MPNATDLSLLYPQGYNPQFSPGSVEEETTRMTGVSFISDLAAEPIIDALRSALRFQPNQKHPIAYFTSDNHVIAYRLDVVEDIFYNDSLFHLLAKLAPELDNMKQLHTVRDVPDDTTLALYSAAEIELYIECIQNLFDYFHKESNRFRSAGIKRLAAEVIEVYESSSFQTLKAETAKVNRSIRNIKSVTIGINLDSQLNPVEAGLVSINTESFQSGNIIDKLLRVDFGNNEYTCLAPLQIVRKGMSPEHISRFNSTVNSTLNSVLKSSLKSWQPAIRAYTLASSKFLIPLADEIRFLLGGVSFLRKLQAHKLPLCKPQTAEMTKRTCTIRGLYNPVIVLKQQNLNEENLIVTNDIQFDESGMFYVLTGPNQGGKTVFAQAVGIAQMMFQLGLFVPAREAVISPVDNIFTHFQSNEYGTVSHGRFGEECSRLMNIFEKLTPYSMLLMDETFSSTSAAEASMIAEQVVIGLSALGCRVIFATHLHELAHHIDKLNQHPQAVSRIDHLSAGLEEDPGAPGKRNFIIVRGRPKGSSYARDIAEKYGLTLENMLSATHRRK